MLIEYPKRKTRNSGQLLLIKRLLREKLISVNAFRFLKTNWMCPKETQKHWKQVLKTALMKEGFFVIGEKQKNCSKVSHKWLNLAKKEKNRHLVVNFIFYLKIRHLVTKFSIFPIVSLLSTKNPLIKTSYTS